MAKKKRITTEEDGTPVEIEEEIADELPEVSAEEASPKVEKPRKRTVVWTEEGEKAGAFSEHGQHTAGETVETDHADVLIDRGFAKEAE